MCKVSAKIPPLLGLGFGLCASEGFFDQLERARSNESALEFTVELLRGNIHRTTRDGEFAPRESEKSLEFERPRDFL